MKPISKTIAIISSALLLIAALAPSVQAASIKVGGSCTTIGKTAKVAGKTLVCTKVGKTKVWKIKAIAAPAPTPTPTIVASDFTKCTLPVADGRGDVAIGLPRIADRGKTLGTVKATVVFVDFPDTLARPTPEAALSVVNPKATQIFSEMSYGKFDYKLEPNLQWLMMSKPSTAYSYSTYQSHHDFVQEVISLADATTDFSKTDSLIVITNPNQRALAFGPAIAFPTSGGFLVDGKLINNGATSGRDMTYWGAAWLNHEIGHSLGLVDLYSYGASYETQFKYTGDFSLMGLSDEESQSPSLLAWERLVLGWLDKNQLICAPNPTGDYTLYPVETAGGTKAVVIPTGTTTALVVESRRALGIDSKLAKPGLIVYRIDTSKQSGLGPVQLFSNTSQAADPRYLKAPLAIGESITVDGYTFSHKSASATADVLNITR